MVRRVTVHHMTSEPVPGRDTPPPNCDQSATTSIADAMDTYTVRLPHELAVQIQHEAEADDRTWSWMVRRLIEDGLRARGIEPVRARGVHLS